MIYSQRVTDLTTDYYTSNDRFGFIMSGLSHQCPTCSRIISVVLALRCSHLYRLTGVGRLFHTCETNDSQM